MTLAGSALVLAAAPPLSQHGVGGEHPRTLGPGFRQRAAHPTCPSLSSQHMGCSDLLVTRRGTSGLLYRNKWDMYHSTLNLSCLTGVIFNSMLFTLECNVYLDFKLSVVKLDLLPAWCCAYHPPCWKFSHCNFIFISIQQFYCDFTTSYVVKCSFPLHFYMSFIWIPLNESPAQHKSDYSFINSFLIVTFTIMMFWLAL